MMKAIKNFMNKPITWGDSFKWSGTFLGLYAAVIGACVAYEKWTNYKAEKEMLKKIPDLVVLYEDTWAALEGKKSARASHRPNQDYYVEKMNEMSYAAFIYPENKEEILNELERSFQARRSARLSGCE